MKRFLSVILVCVLCFALSMTAFASDESQNTRALGYGSDYGYSGEFEVNVPSGGSTGRITVGIESPDQSQLVWFKVIAPNGTVIWDHSTFDTPGHMGVYPNNAAEILSPIYSNFQSGTYTVQYTSLVQVRFNCWIYNW